MNIIFLLTGVFGDDLQIALTFFIDFKQILLGGAKGLFEFGYHS
jgi:hypothetical protein